MKIYVVNNMIPHLHGGAEDLANYLVMHLRRHGHDTELVRVPFRYEPAERLYESTLACRLMEIGDADLVIGLKFPAYLIRHPNKVVWMVHQYRQAYDMWDSGHTNIQNNEEGESLRQSIHEADEECFRSVEKIFAISPVVQQRLAKYNQTKSEVLRPPLNGVEDFKPGEYGDYIFCGGRINRIKRQHLLIEAMRYTKQETKIVVAGPADTPADGDRLRKLVEKYGLQDRVRLEIGYLPRKRIVKLMTNALAVAYLPVDEDYGYIAVEANHSGKPLITSNDSGGLLDIVIDGQTGWVRTPDVASIAGALDAAFADRKRTIELGQHAREQWLKRGITWENTVEKLIA